MIQAHKTLTLYTLLYCLLPAKIRIPIHNVFIDQHFNESTFYLSHEKIRCSHDAAQLVNSSITPGFIDYPQLRSGIPSKIFSLTSISPLHLISIQLILLTAFVCHNDCFLTLLAPNTGCNLFGFKEVRCQQLADFNFLFLSC